MTRTLPDLDARLDELMVHDRERLRARLGRLDPARGADRLVAEIERAEARVAARAAAVPALRYPAQLPVTERREDILSALRDHQVVVVAGDTGSGKSTQLPKLCLESGRGVRGMIGHTQPRRLAARTIAARVAEELGTPLGGAVGYAVRFQDTVGEQTLVKVMTDGILLAEIRRDRRLTRYDTIIVDEAHERSLNVDFLLGYLKRLLPERPDLKVVITSATIDTERFAAHFGAPVVEVSGRTYPVELRYRPIGETPDDDRDQVQAICDAVDELSAEGTGDILVFLSGEREIHDTADALREQAPPGTEVLPLYARLAHAEQQRIFQPHPGRRVVLATNVAETSLTVPGIRYVVDAGTARISRYSRRLKVQRLPIEPISQASADQRAGRCGRVAPGICIRLYSEEDLAGRPPYTEPEILRTNLASVLLQMATLGLGEVAGFPFVEPPDSRAVRDGVLLLEELGAFTPGEPDPRRRLTPLGRRLAQLPIDPRLGRMVLEAERNGCVREVLVIAAALSINDPRERPADQREAAEQLHRRFADERSDFCSYLRLWEYLRERQRALSGNQFRRMCRAEHLHHLRVREWQDLTSQLRQAIAGLGIRTSGEPADPDRIHLSLLAGLLSQVGRRDDKGREFTGARNARFALGRGSVLAKKPPRWVMVGELVETNRLWGRTAAAVRPEWIERVGAHLVRRSHGEPYWDEQRGGAMALEKVTLYGLTIVSGRPVGYRRIDPEAARDLFIRHALVQGEWHTHHRVVRQNRELLDELREREDRARRGQLVVGDEDLHRFYDERLPADVTSGRHFDGWWKQARGPEPDLLTLTRAHLLGPAATEAATDDFPDTWVQDELELDLRYVFRPGSPTDGVVVEIPLAVLNRVQAQGFDWQVPGHREELVTALIRSLPKPLRRSLVPAADHARAFVAEASPDDGPLLDVLARLLSARGGTRLTPDAFDPRRVPDHLRISFAALDDGGTTIATSDDLGVLQRRLAGRIRSAVADAAPDLERQGLTTWTIGTLPQAVRARRQGRVVVGYPALVDEGESVAVRILTDPGTQAAAMALGTRRLLLLTLPSPRREVERALPPGTTLALARASLGSVADLLDDCTNASVDHLVAESGGPAWDADGFAALRSAVGEGLVPLATAVAATAGEVAAAAAGVEARLARAVAPTLVTSVADARDHLGRLVHPGFVRDTGVRRLPDLLRYLRALDHRLERVGSDPARDRERLRPVQALEHELATLARALPEERRGDVERVRWMLEELRVSLFAQAIGTAYPVSEQRVRRELAVLARG